MDTDVLANLIDAKHELLVQLHQLAIQQAELVEQGDLGRIMNLLANKQRLLNAMEQLERQLDPFRAQDPEQRVWQSPTHRERAREVSSRCDALLGEIMSVERSCEAKLSLRRDQAADRLQAAHFSTHATQAYSGAVDMAGHQFDASCES